MQRRKKKKIDRCHMYMTRALGLSRESIDALRTFDIDGERVFIRETRENALFSLQIDSPRRSTSGELSGAGQLDANLHGRARTGHAAIADRRGFQLRNKLTRTETACAARDSFENSAGIITHTRRK